MIKTSKSARTNKTSSKTGKSARTGSKSLWFAKEHKQLILDGTVLALDPSSGSQQSMPGYALYKQGILVDSGFIQLAAGEELQIRLGQLHRTLVEDFLNAEQIDVVVTEMIPITAFGRSRVASYSMLPLQRSVGVIMGVFGHLPFCQVAIATWKKYTDQQYVKSDETDAIYIGKTIIILAGETPHVTRVRKPKVPSGSDVQAGTPSPRKKVTRRRKPKDGSP